MTVLLNELQVPGWAGVDGRIGLGDVTGIYGSTIAYSLPCHNTNPEIFFADDDATINAAKSICGGCPVRQKCLTAALSRQEPCGVWGGELFEDGAIIERKRRAGRPRIAAFAS